MSIDFDPKLAYLDYIQQNQVKITPTASAQLTQILDRCQWEHPQTALEWNNLAITALIAAESCDNALTHGLYWFERELEFWRQYLQPGMIAIDIGASFGMYTFSAASRVGVNGMVYAIEPFSQSVDCLAETCRINQLTNVKVFNNAISDRTAQLILQHSSEFNYLAADDRTIEVDTQVAEVTCLTLDAFVQQQQIEQIDIIKISTEGSEIAILIGCQATMTRFAPTTIYHNYTSKCIDLAAAEYSIDRGYNLCRYQPYLQQLIPLVNQSDFAEVVKAIALHAGDANAIPQPNS